MFRLTLGNDCLLVMIAFLVFGTLWDILDFRKSFGNGCPLLLIWDPFDLSRCREDLMRIFDSSPGSPSFGPEVGKQLPGEQCNYEGTNT
jgi:hypothetical protein